MPDPDVSQEDLDHSLVTLLHAGSNLVNHVAWCMAHYPNSPSCSMPHAHKMSFARKLYIYEEIHRIVDKMWATYSRR